jgi:hypothetical protein
MASRTAGPGFPILLVNLHIDQDPVDYLRIPRADRTIKLRTIGSCPVFASEPTMNLLSLDKLNCVAERKLPKIPYVPVNPNNLFNISSYFTNPFSIVTPMG